MPKVQQAAPVAGRGHRGRRVATSLAEINVVPLVDVMLVLLIIFMVTAPMIQRGVEVNIPVSTRSTEISTERVFVSIPLSYRQDHVVFLSEKPIGPAVFQERVRQAMEGRAKKEVFLRGDAGVQYQELMEVFDQLKAAGVETVGLVTKLPGER
ncbi:MAG: biopolymer transporter ExbD [Acidobacteria bacterium]|nr:biopolymer transporter ExbD [Acidobacteriota bacterium]